MSVNLWVIKKTLFKYFSPCETMAQIIDPLPNDQNKALLCCYVNATSQIQVARITNVEDWYFERVVFPGQRLVFEALSHGILEIHTGMMASAILSDTIPFPRLAMQESPIVPSESASGLDAESIQEVAAIAQ